MALLFYISCSFVSHVCDSINVKIKNSLYDFLHLFIIVRYCLKLETLLIVEVFLKMSAFPIYLCHTYEFPSSYFQSERYPFFGPQICIY